MYFDPIYLLITLVFGGLSLAVSSTLKRKFKKYSQMRLWSDLSGKEAAEQMLRDHQIHDVSVTCVAGQLTDHYNPANKTVNLSEDVYHGKSAASVAVAAHECGHAVQHATAYSMLQFRSALVPIQNISATVLNVVFMMMYFGAFMLQNAFPMQLALLIIIACYGAFALFSIVTLPVEYDASNRALKWIQANNIVTDQEYDAAKDALKWAARTYLVAALGAIATLLYFVLRFIGSGDD